jgi:hypothetical protein
VHRPGGDSSTLCGLLDPLGGWELITADRAEDYGSQTVAAFELATVSFSGTLNSVREPAWSLLKQGGARCCCVVLD